MDVWSKAVVRQWFSPGIIVSSTIYNRLVITQPQYGRKSDEKWKFKIPWMKVFAGLISMPGNPAAVAD